MSSVLKEFKKYIQKEKLYKKFFKSQPPGSRIVPPRDPRNDEKYQLRFDAGDVAEGYKIIKLQANSKAKNSGIKTYVAKNGRGTHGDIAVGRIKLDTPEGKQEEEFENFMADIDRQYREKIG